MLPSVSAYTRFCDGTSNSSAAERNSSQFVAWLRAKTASAVRPGVSAVHDSETAYPSGLNGAGSGVGASAPASSRVSRTSEMIGPCTVERTVNGTSLLPATRIVSSRVSIGSCCPSRR